MLYKPKSGLLGLPSAACTLARLCRAPTELAVRGCCQITPVIDPDHDEVPAARHFKPSRTIRHTLTTVSTARRRSDVDAGNEGRLAKGRRGNKAKGTPETLSHASRFTGSALRVDMMRFV